MRTSVRVCGNNKPPTMTESTALVCTVCLRLDTLLYMSITMKYCMHAKYVEVYT